MNTAPLSGMLTAQTQVDQSASRIARFPVSQSQQPADSVDLSTEMVGLMRGRNNFEANVKAFHVQDEMTKATLDILA